MKLRKSMETRSNRVMTAAALKAKLNSTYTTHFPQAKYDSEVNESVDGGTTTTNNDPPYN